MTDAEERAQGLEEELARVRRDIAEEREAARKCFVCGDKPYEYGGETEYLEDFRIVLAQGSHLNADIDGDLCDEHFDELCDLLINFGIKVHYHGGIHALEDRTCIGSEQYGECPTPEDRWGDPAGEDE